MLGIKIRNKNHLMAVLIALETADINTHGYTFEEETLNTRLHIIVDLNVKEVFLYWVDDDCLVQKINPGYDGEYELENIYPFNFGDIQYKSFSSNFIKALKG